MEQQMTQRKILVGFKKLEKIVDKIESGDLVVEIRADEDDYNRNLGVLLSTPEGRTSVMTKLLTACYEANEIREGWRVEGNRDEIPPYKITEQYRAQAIIKIVKSRVTPVGFIKFIR